MSKSLPPGWGRGLRQRARQLPSDKMSAALSPSLHLKRALNARVGERKRRRFAPPPPPRPCSAQLVHRLETAAEKTTGNARQEE